MFGPDIDAKLMEPTATGSTTPLYDVFSITDLGTNRNNNEDAVGHHVEDGGDTIVVAVADGVGGYEGGEVASALAIEQLIQAYRESPVGWGTAKRLYRAMQTANIEVHNKALAVPELRSMATTLTAVVIEKGMLHAAHIGDCRLFHLRGHQVRQMTKDHTVVGERMRLGILTAAEAREHPDRSVLQRTLGRELIASIDRVSFPLVKDDRVVLCSDG